MIGLLLRILLLADVSRSLYIQEPDYRPLVGSCVGIGSCMSEYKEGVRDPDQCSVSWRWIHWMTT